MNILLTGGSGFIGSHTAAILIEAGLNPILLDNFCNSTKDVSKVLQKIYQKKIISIEGDIRDTPFLIKILNDYKISSVIHFAALKSVAESVKYPLQYFLNNIQGTISLLDAMTSVGVKKIVFSSSATVYGNPRYLPIDEEHETFAINPYGRTKLHIEEMLSDIACADSGWSIACLRYFNPAGAHSSGLLGERPNGIPNNLIPFITDVLIKKREYVNIYGNDYQTHDGTGVRDFIHILDLAEGHLSALNYLKSKNGFHVFNLGTGYGLSVLEIIKNFENISGKNISYVFKSRRDGDVDICYANPEKAKILLNWSAKRGIQEICESTLNWSNKLA